MAGILKTRDLATNLQYNEEAELGNSEIYFSFQIEFIVNVNLGTGKLMAFKLPKRWFPYFNLLFLIARRNKDRYFKIEQNKWTKPKNLKEAPVKYG